MSVFRFEVRRQLPGALLGAAALAGALLVLFAGVWPIYSEARMEVERMLAGYPPAFLVAFGFGDDIFSYAGFFNFAYLYLALMATILGAVQSISIFGREPRSGSAEFLYSRPVTRSGVYISKLLALLLITVVEQVPYLLAALWCRGEYGAGESMGGALAAALSVTGAQVVFSTLGVLVATAARRIGNVSGTGAAIGLIGFVLAMLPQLTGEEAFRVVSPLRYFDVLYAFSHSSLEGGYLVLAGLVSAVSLVAAWVISMRRDLVL